MQELPAWDGLGALTQLTLVANDGLQALPPWEGLGELTQLSIRNHYALRTLGGVADLKNVQDLRLDGVFLPAALAEIATLPALHRLMLPTNLQGTELDRAKGLPSVEVRFLEPGSDEWFEEWKPGES